MQIKYKIINTRLIQHALDEIAITQFVDFRSKLPIMTLGSKMVRCANFVREQGS